MKLSSVCDVCCHPPSSRYFLHQVQCDSFSPQRCRSVVFFRKVAELVGSWKCMDQNEDVNWDLELSRLQKHDRLCDELQIQNAFCSWWWCLTKIIFLKQVNRAKFAINEAESSIFSLNWKTESTWKPMTTTILEGKHVVSSQPAPPSH